MTAPTPYAKDLGNLLYHSAIVCGLSVGYSIIGKIVLKMKPADFGRLDVEDSAKIVGTNPKIHSVRHCAKFREDPSNRSRDMADFRFFKMAAAAILFFGSFFMVTGCAC